MRTRSAPSSTTTTKRVRRRDDSSSDDPPSKRRASTSISTYTPPTTPTKPLRRRTTVEVVIPPPRVRRLKPNKNVIITQKTRQQSPEVEQGDAEESESEEDESKSVVEDIEVEEEEEEEEVITPPPSSPKTFTLPTPKPTTTKFVVVAAPPPPPPRLPTNIFSHAASLLSTASGTPFHGRTPERTKLTNFLSARFSSLYASSDASTSTSSTNTPPARSTPPRPSLYISGPPGIGKTALLLSVLEEFKRKIEENDDEEIVKVVMENCSSVGSVGMEAVFWERLSIGLELDTNLSKGGIKLKGREAFEKAINKSTGRKYLIILDEIDHLLPSTSPSSTRSDLLNTIFSLVHAPNSPLTLIGIANALDLTSRALRLESLPVFSSPSSSSHLPSPSPSPKKSSSPKTLEGSPSSKSFGPQYLPFRPYDPEALESIVRSRLSLLVDSYPLASSSESDSTSHRTWKSSIPLPLVEPKALELCAKRVAKGSGDVRAVLGVVRRAVSMVERDQAAKVVKEEKDKMMEEDEPVASTSTTLLPEEDEEEISSSPLSTISPTTLSPTAMFLSSFTPLTAPKVSMKTMLDALRLGGLGTPPGLATQLSSLPYDHRLALIGIVVSLAKDDVEHGTLSGFDLRHSDSTYVFSSEAYQTYSQFSRMDETLQTRKFMRLGEFGDVLNSLECAGFILGEKSAEGLVKKKSVKHKKKVGSGRIVVLSKNEYSVAELVEGLKTVPSNHSDDVDGNGKGEKVLEEILRVSKIILDREGDKLEIAKRKKKGLGGMKGKDVEAPREGFHGGGLDESGKAKYLGEKKKN